MCFVFFFKQKTAYEMRISDWSSDVCSSDLPAPGLSTGEAMAEVEALLKQLPAGIGHEWTGLSYEERRSGAQAPALYALSLLIVFLCLAALYESWSIPPSVMLEIGRASCRDRVCQSL